MFFEYIKSFFLIYFISMCGMYLLSYRAKGPIEFPGDILTKKAQRMFYIPISSGLVLAIVLFMLYKSFVAPYTIGKAPPATPTPYVDLRSR